MSLKAFHLVFIVAAILLALGFGVWSLLDYFSPHGRHVGSGRWESARCVAALAWLCYERFFLKKFKNVSYL